MIRIDSISGLRAQPFDEIIDVRSPSEYADDHVPGAISLPVLSDAERAEVGTIYKQVEPFQARKIGAALVARNAAAHLQGPLADRPFRWRPLVYCWRGGQRSGAFASILCQVGWQAETIEGGYKSWRRLVVDALYDRPLPHRLVLIDGNTGTAKTRLLALLADAGAQMVDLEGLAEHRGSLLGGWRSQPSQKLFETRLAAAFAALDPARPVYVEAEAAKVGNLLVPKSVLGAMRIARQVEIEAPLPARADYLLRSYADMVSDREALAERVAKLRNFHSAEVLEGWLALARAGQFHALASDLMERHYDPRYAKAAAARTGRGEVLRLADLDDDTLRRSIPEILRLGEALLERG